MVTTLKTRFQNKHDIPANWEKAVNFIPLAGELVIYDDHYFDANGQKIVVADTVRFKIGDGIMQADGTVKGTKVNDLPFTDITYEEATALAAGLMSAADKQKLDGIDAQANKYIHPTYTEKTSGLYKITVDNSGHVSSTAAVVKSDITDLGIPGEADTDTTVKLSDDLYTNYNIGRIKNATESSPVLIGEKDWTIRQMFENLFTAQAEVPTTTLPSLSLSLSNDSSSIEYGKAVTFTATVTANTGRLNSSYYSGGYTTDTGVSWSTLNLVSTNSTFTSKTSGITSGTSFTVTPSTTYYAVASGGTIKGKATAPSGYTSSGKVAKNNLGNDTDVKISSSTSAKESSEASTSVSAGYVPYTYVLSASLPTSLPTSNRNKNKPTSISVSGGNANTYLYIFVPSSASISTIKSGGFGVPFTCVETSKSYTVNNDKATTFKVYKTDSTVVSNTFDIS